MHSCYHCSPDHVVSSSFCKVHRHFSSLVFSSVSYAKTRKKDPLNLRSGYLPMQTKFPAICWPDWEFRRSKEMVARFCKSTGQSTKTDRMLISWRTFKELADAIVSGQGSVEHICAEMALKERELKMAARVFCIQTLNQRALTTLHKNEFARNSFLTGLIFACSILKSVYSDSGLDYCPRCQTSTT